MKTHNAQNERIKRTYFTYLAEAELCAKVGDGMKG
jgi:hypothetical protein